MMFSLGGTGLFSDPLYLRHVQLLHFLSDLLCSAPVLPLFCGYLSSHICSFLNCLPLISTPLDPIPDACSSSVHDASRSNTRLLHIVQPVIAARGFKLR